MTTPRTFSKYPQNKIAQVIMVKIVKLKCIKIISVKENSSLSTDFTLLQP